MLEGKTKYQDFTLTASEAATAESNGFKFEDDWKEIHSVVVEASLPNQAYYRGSQRLEINGDELLPTGFDTRKLMANQAVAPNQRFYDLGKIDPGNKILKISYKDTAHASAAFSAYTVKYTFKGIKK